jgi:protein O-mannosyl-transferase
MSRKTKKKVRPQRATATPFNPGVPTADKPDWILGLLLLLAVIIAYQPVWHAGFIWDDYTHITENETLRSARGLWQIWFQPGATCQYYPLSFTCWWVGYHLWSLNPLGYHLLNVAVHGVTAVMLWQVLKRLEVRAAWLAGTIFALHPVNVMSVAWMTELKNTLSGGLVLGAVWAYLRFARLGVYAAAETDRAGWRFGLLTLALFQLAMFAKTAVSFLPVTLLLLLWWKRGRLTWRYLWPVLPMFAIAAGMGMLTFYVERLYGTASDEFRMGLLDRILVSGKSFWFYLGKLFFPYPLTFIYERWKIDPGVWWQYLYPAATLGLLGGVWLRRNRIGKGFFSALLYFYITTSMLILMQVLFFTRYSYVSDHWQYFGCMSVIALMAAGIDQAFDFVRPGNLSLKRAFCGLLLLALGTLTWQQCKMYTDIETLWRTTIARNPSSWLAQGDLGYTLFGKGDTAAAMAQYNKALELNPDYADAHFNLGSALLQLGKSDEAIVHYQRALQIRPNDSSGHYNLGNALFAKGEVDGAIAQFRLALELNPAFADALNNLGLALFAKGEVDEAILQYTQALQLNPAHYKTHNNLARALLRNRRIDEAIVHCQQALQISPNNAEAHSTFGSALLQKGSVDEAIAHFQQALQIKPADAETQCNLGIALFQKGSVAEAIAHFQQALQIKPDDAAAMINLAWVLATTPQASLRNGTQAVGLAQQANQLAGGKNPFTLHVLAAAYAEAGRFGDAIESAQKAVDLARASGQTDLMNQISGELKLYAAGLPFHQ